MLDKEGVLYCNIIRFEQGTKSWLWKNGKCREFTTYEDIIVKNKSKGNTMVSKSTVSKIYEIFVERGKQENSLMVNWSGLWILEGE